MSGGLTNLNYRVDVDGESFVVRIWATGTELLGIDRQREYQCTVAASQTGVAPEVVHFLPDAGIMVTRFVPGRHLAPGEIARPEVLERVVQSMRRYHAGPAFDGSFSPLHTVAVYLGVARRFDAPLPEDADQMPARLREIAQALRRGRTVVRPCHNDLWGPNLIDDGSQVRIVDWEYAGMGDICFDLANFAIHHTSSDDHDEALLRTYFVGVSNATFARLKLLKIVAELREALWYLVAINVSRAASDFLDLARTHFDRYRHALSDSRVSAWLDQAAY